MRKSCFESSAQSVSPVKYGMETWWNVVKNNKPHLGGFRAQALTDPGLLVSVAGQASWGPSGPSTNRPTSASVSNAGQLVVLRRKLVFLFHVSPSTDHRLYLRWNVICKCWLGENLLQESWLLSSAQILLRSGKVRTSWFWSRLSQNLTRKNLLLFKCVCGFDQNLTRGSWVCSSAQIWYAEAYKCEKLDFDESEQMLSWTIWR